MSADNNNEPLSFEKVLEEELDALRSTDRDADDDEDKINQYAKAHLSQLVGLAFSGGGIRSATFNLGVLQALAKYGLLGKFDYLSTVSGGGYIGSWLSAWLRSEPLESVEKKLRREIDRRKKNEPIPEDIKWSPITFLRHFSNYLTPKTGLLSLDTWTAVATYCRNLLLNLSILTLALAGILVLPRILVELLLFLRGLPLDIAAGIGVFLIMVSLAFTAINLDRSSNESKSPRSIATLVVLPLLLSGTAIAFWMPSLNGVPLADYRVWMLGTAGVYLGCWGIAILCVASVRSRAGKTQNSQSASNARTSVELDSQPGRDGGIKEKSNTDDKYKWLKILLWASIAGAIGGAALRLLAGRFNNLTMDSAQGWIEVATWGPPAVLLIFFLIASVHVGLAGRTFPESNRQWWSRLGGWLLILSIAWILLFAVVFYGPAILRWLGIHAKSALSLSGLTWVVATAAGLSVGRNSVPKGRSAKRWLEFVAPSAPYIFVIGLLMVISLALQRFAMLILKISAPSASVLDRIEVTSTMRELWMQEEYLLAETQTNFPLLFLIIAVSGFAMAIFLSWRFNVNEFSMHNFYRNRLIRAYLGASRVNVRQPVRFTGFDPDDDVRLVDLRNNEGPLHIINTTLNLTAGQELAWQERKAASFFFTPLHFGYDPGRFGAKLKEKGFRRTPDDDNFSLGTALAISGAALNPNMGYHSSAPLAFLLTIFNSRLGWWLMNPRLDNWQSRGPRLGLYLLLRELVGSTSASSRYVNLADGGFFDNLGIYELVRRRCRFILACDAEADPRYEFNALGNAIRRCRSDFGVNIKIQLDPIRRQAESGHSRWHCAVGRIYYDSDDKGPIGTLVYLKASLTGDEPEDLLNYASRCPEFPHESTADQWFGESQFECYRTLGYHATDELLGTAGVGESPDIADDDDTAKVPRNANENADNMEKVFLALRHAWFPPSAATARSFTRHTEKLVEIFDRLRQDEQLAFLDKSLYLDLEEWKATGEVRAPASDEVDGTPAQENFRAAFYMCSLMLQLMENVYLDLALHQDADHPDNRGWMNLFRHWASSNAFRKTWAVSAATYGARFQTFCQRRLNLRLGKIQVEKIPLSESCTLALSKREREIYTRITKNDDSITLLCLLRMSVPTPGEPNVADMKFTIGFALLTESTTSKELKYFRIRNHLRQLGHGRQAMRQLVHDMPLTRDNFVELDFAPGRRQELKNLFQSVINERTRH